MPRVEINGQVVEFEQMPTPADIDHAAASLARPTAPPDTPLPSRVSVTGSTAAPAPPDAGPTLATQLREHAPLIGQVGGGLAGGPFAPLTGFLGGVAGSAIQRGGLPTAGDIGTAALGEALPMVPGVGRAVRGAVGRFLGPEATQLAERFKIPLSVPESMRGLFSERVMPWLARSPFGARTVNRAGRAQSEAIGQAAGRIGERFGGELPAPAFASQARRAILQTVKRLTPGKGEAALAAAKEIAGQTLDKAALAEAVAKDPVRLATVMKTVGDQGMNDLRAAWWTSVLESATGKQGLRKGVISPQRIVDAWDGLAGSKASADAILAAQTALFGPRRKLMADFVETLRHTQAADLVGKSVHVPFRWQIEVPAAAGSMLFGEMRPYAMGVVATEAALPWVAAHALVNGPPGAIGRLLGTAGPTAVRAGVQMLGGSEESSPAVPPAAAPVAPPAAPPQRLAYDPSDLNTEAGIQRALNTRLPPGFRPGRSRVAFGP